MGVTKIEWTATTLPDGTVQPGFSFNPWHGCTKVSSGCRFCYADAQDRRFGPSHWGPGAERKMLSEANWRKPLQWNADAAAAGTRARVFCASMADVFEQLPQEHLSFGDQDAARFHLWKLIAATPSLDWLLLTKRPENILEMVPLMWVDDGPEGWPSNVWVGTSVEDQATANERIPHLLRVPAGVRFLSCEPLLGPVNLRCIKTKTWIGDCTIDALAGAHHHGRLLSSEKLFSGKNGGIHWVIVGGESGPHARPMHPDWARQIRDECQAAGVPYFFKQWGAWKPLESEAEAINHNAARLWDWQGDPRLLSINLGKHDAGRLLDGRTWDEFPLQHTSPLQDDSPLQLEVSA